MYLFLEGLAPCIVCPFLNHLADLIVSKLHIGMLALCMGMSPVVQFLIIVTF
jgi:hypothetical protein